MTYNTELKQNSTMKRTMNKFLSTFIQDDSRALVLDAETMMTSTCLTMNGMKPEHITVINTAGDIIDKAHQNGHTDSIKGISTDVMKKLTGTYDIIYLDYCGTPDSHKSGFNPAYDLLWAADRVRDNGIIITTFSRRTKDAIEKANDLIPYTMTLAKEVSYCETVPMYCMILTKLNPRMVRDKFNTMKRTIVDSIETAFTLTKMKPSNKKNSEQAYINRMKVISPEKYSVIAYYQNNHLWKGIVEDIHRDGRVKILWVDPLDTYDYGKHKGYYPIKTHINIDDASHNDADGNWCYLYDTYSVETIDEAEEMEPLPITMNRQNYIKLKKDIVNNMKKKKYTGLIQYFGIKD